VRKSLKKAGLSWKKSRKILNKASSKERAEYLDILKGLLEEVLQSGRIIVFIDEAHIHLDTDEGYGWTVKGERAWISSSSPGRRKVSFYGVYIYNLGEVRIFPYDKAEKFNTIDVLKRIRTEFPDEEMTVVWDGASYHRAGIVKQEAEALDISLQRLSGYSPDFMPVEHLWQWLREDVTYHICHNSEAELIQRVSDFQQAINAFPLVLSDRLWVKTHLNSKEEKLRVSS
jgi:transposase